MHGVVVSGASVSSAALGAVLSLGRAALEGADGADGEDADHKAGEVQAGGDDPEEADGRVAALHGAVHGGVAAAGVEPLPPPAHLAGVHLPDQVQVQPHGRQVRQASQQAEGTFAHQQPWPQLLDGFGPHDEEDEGERGPR